MLVIRAPVCIFRVSVGGRLGSAVVFRVGIRIPQDAMAVSWGCDGSVLGTRWQELRAGVTKQLPERLSWFCEPSVCTSCSKPVLFIATYALEQQSLTHHRFYLWESSDVLLGVKNSSPSRCTCQIEFIFIQTGYDPPNLA